MNKTLTFLFILISITMSCNKSTIQLSAFDAYEKKQFAIAIDLYIDKYNDNDEQQALYAYKISKSYIEVKNYKEAYLWAKNAYQIEDNEDHSILYSETLVRKEDYNKALLMIDEHHRKYGENKLLVAKRNQLKQAGKWKSGASENLFKVSEANFNSPEMDYSPVYYKRDILFTSDRNVNDNKPLYAWTGNEYSDIFIKKDNQITSFSSVINSDYNEGNITFSKNEDFAIFNRCDYVKDDVIYCKLMSSTWDDGEWGNPTPLNFFNDDVNEVHPCLIESDEVLIFAANTIDSRGGYDLFYAIRENDSWSQAFPMPDYINTVGNELFPTSHNDTLYFSSDQLLGMGSLDIFKSFLINNKWSIPVNLEAPINSGYDDFGFVVDPNFVQNPKALKAGIFSSNRKGGRGLDDIYQFIEQINNQEPIDTIIDDPIIYNVFVLFKILDSEKNSISDVKIESNHFATSFSDEEGKYFFKSVEETPYDFLFKAKNKLHVSFNYKHDLKLVSSLNKDTTIIFEIEMLGKEKGKEIILDNIYYEFDQYQLTDEAKSSLNDLVRILNDNSTIRIELGAHTDCRGESTYNQNLSQKRSQSVVDFLIAEGIQSSRLNALGYGESKPLIDCVCDDCKENQHQLNRRTSFTIIY